MKLQFSNLHQNTTHPVPVDALSSFSSSEYKIAIKRKKRVNPTNQRKNSLYSKHPPCQAPSGGHRSSAQPCPCTSFPPHKRSHSVQGHRRLLLLPFGRS